MGNSNSKQEMPLFSTPFPLQRAIAPRIFSTHVRFKACSTNDLSPNAVRLRTMQKRILDRRNALRAQGVRGKADESKHSEEYQGVLKELEAIKDKAESGEIILSKPDSLSAQDPPNTQSSSIKTYSSTLPQSNDITDLNVQNNENKKQNVSTSMQMFPTHIETIEEQAPINPIATNQNHPISLQREMLLRRRQQSKIMSNESSGADLLHRKQNSIGTTAQLHTTPRLDMLNISEEIDNKELTLLRRSGSLPWRNRVPSGNEEAIEKIPLLPMSHFTGNDNFIRSDGSLPKVRRTKQKRVTKTITKQTSSTTDKIQSINKDCSTILQNLNNKQIQAVHADPSKACLILAGPGSGKTRVLTHRIAYLMKNFDIPPYKILAVTFTNKAASEMKERVSHLLSEQLESSVLEETRQRVRSNLLLGTFHSISARFLRMYGEEIGISSNFDICDTADSKQILSRIIKQYENANIDSSTLEQTRSTISKLKNDVNDKMKNTLPSRVFKRISELGNLYQKELRTNNLLDFDDLLLETRRMLLESSKIRDDLQDRFEYVLVDEWQDTNHVQFDLVSLLAGKQKNLFVVGDADQSIYKFRGADSGNVNRFYETYPDAAKVILDRNYRSTGCIVKAATSVIEKSLDRPEKPMITMNEFGEKIHIHETFDDKGEANFIVSILKKLFRTHEIGSFSNSAVLYRTNAQSRLLEEACIKNDIPYRLHAGVKFYQRQEIKDVIAYIKIIVNPADDYSFRRIVNTPPRGIGKKTVEIIQEYAESQNCSLSEAVNKMMTEYALEESSLDHLNLRKTSLKKIVEFHSLLQSLRNFVTEFANNQTLTENTNEKESGIESIILHILEVSNYREYLTSKVESDDTEKEKVGQIAKVRDRVDNVEELVRGASRFDSIEDFLQNIALMNDMDNEKTNDQQDTNGAVSLMTLHAGKGLEFDTVFIVGVEDNVIPMRRSEEENLAGIDEERRLLYVGMTRAKKQLYMTWRSQKLMVSGKKLFRVKGCGPSRFLNDIPSTLKQGSDLKKYNSTRNFDDNDDEIQFFCKF